MYQLRGGKILPIVLPSMVKVEKFSDHARRGTIIRIKQVLNSTGSMVGIAWFTVCWGVMMCIRVGHADGGDSFPSDIRACQTAHRHIPNM